MKLHHFGARSSDRPSPQSRYTGFGMRPCGSQEKQSLQPAARRYIRVIHARPRNRPGHHKNGFSQGFFCGGDAAGAAPAANLFNQMLTTTTLPYAKSPPNLSISLRPRRGVSSLLTLSVAPAAQAAAFFHLRPAAMQVFFSFFSDGSTMTPKATKHAQEPQKLGTGPGPGGRDPVPTAPAAVSAKVLVLAVVLFVQGVALCAALAIAQVNLP